MYARVFTSRMKAGKADQAVAIWRDNVAPLTQQAKGFKGAYLIGNSANGKGLTITLWESKEDADAMNKSLTQSLSLFDGFWEQPPELESYEVLLQL